MQIVEKHRFYSGKFYIKYTTPWENVLDIDLKAGATLCFYPGDTDAIVEVAILADRDKLTSNDIIVYLGSNHTSESTKELVLASHDKIFNLCKRSVEMEFVLDLDTMKVVTKDDFFLSTPLIDSAPFFTTKGIGDPFFRILINPNDTIFSTDEIFTWLLSILMASKICVKPIDKVTVAGKYFLQGISALAYGKGVSFIKDKSILNADLSYIEELQLPIPGGKTQRIKELMSRKLETK